MSPLVRLLQTTIFSSRLDCSTFCLYGPTKTCVQTQSKQASHNPSSNNTNQTSRTCCETVGRLNPSLLNPTRHETTRSRRRNAVIRGIINRKCDFCGFWHLTCFSFPGRYSVNNVKSSGDNRGNEFSASGLILNNIKG